MSEKKKPSGAIWKRNGTYGEYLSGQVEIDGVKLNFKAYPNEYKKEEKHPDFKLFLDPKKEAPTPVKLPKPILTLGVDEEILF